MNKIAVAVVLTISLVITLAFIVCFYSLDNSYIPSDSSCSVISSGEKEYFYVNIDDINKDNPTIYTRDELNNFEMIGGGYAGGR